MKGIKFDILYSEHFLYSGLFRTRDEIFALFNNHVKAVNAIYEDTDFNGIKGINFVVQRTTVNACLSL